MTSLRELGLTEYEEKVYLTLLKHGSLTGGKTSKLSQVPHGRTYEVLHKLAQKGFVSVLEVKPKIFKAVDLKTAVSSEINHQIDKLHKLENLIPKELKDQEHFPLEKKIDQHISIFSGKKNMEKVIADTIKKSKKYVKTMYTYEQDPISVHRLQNHAIKRKVKIQHIATKLTRQGIKWMKRDIKRGIQVRYYPVEELRLTVRDGKVSFQTMINPRNPKDRITILIESKELTQGLEHYFDELWKKAQKIEEIK
ncbi:MAG: HTH-type sugar sensing transcriptional regulator TrmBL1 [Candidatus Woesearchaeota archaeon]|nr:HTH-type sugar sensing transcriptional regulator TrmBL1 [Candidatus Woesearchaeota archaeon]